MANEVQVLPRSEAVAAIRDAAERIRANVTSVIVGAAEPIDLMLAALLAGGHVLLEDVPGTGKTTLARAFAASIGASFRRIQFTPDLMPSDIHGIHYYSQRTGEFEFRAGPIMANIVLADEVNRATPRTQSALLEAMEERTVTIDGETRVLPAPFMVLATQNPIELEGTFPLPEAQLDRFLLRLAIGYPDEAGEVEVLRRFEARSPLEGLGTVVSADDLVALSASLPQVHVEDAIVQYVVRLCRATREHAAFDLGASPRASLALFRAARALAAISGRDYVSPDDVKRLAQPVLVQPTAAYLAVAAARPQRRRHAGRDPARGAGTRDRCELAPPGPAEATAAEVGACARCSVNSGSSHRSSSSCSG